MEGEGRGREGGEEGRAAAAAAGTRPATRWGARFVARVIKVVKSPRCPLVGFECEVYAGGLRVHGDRKVRVDPSGADAQGGIRGIYQGAVL